MPDMLVNLYTLPESSDTERLKSKGIIIKRALIPDKNRILEFVRANFSEGWVNECEYALFNSPISCYIVVRDKELLGFACYDATAKGFFGPIGIKSDDRHSGLGKALLYRCLTSMREKGYGYAVIGWVEDAVGFYKKTVNAVVIENSMPNQSVYQNLIKME